MISQCDVVVEEPGNGSVGEVRVQKWLDPHFLLSKCEAGKVRKYMYIYTRVYVHKSRFVCVYMRTVALEIPMPDYFDLLTKC